MRDIEFKMERDGLIVEGQEIEVTETYAPGGYAYIMEPAVAMSSLYKEPDRLKCRKGTVKTIRQTEKGYYVTATFEK